MTIGKQDFYEGAALRQLVTAADSLVVSHQPPFFLINKRVVLVKYSTKKRSPWAFTFSCDELNALLTQSKQGVTFVGLVCGSDGIAAVRFADLQRVIGEPHKAIHIACYRRFGEHYEVSGPVGSLKKKVAPSAWRRLASTKDESNEAS